MPRNLLAAIIGVALLSAAPATQTFSGVVTDDNCVNGDHAQMRMGDTDRECAVACNNSHGSPYVLFDGTSAYTLSDQKLAETFAGGKVTVVGTLDAKTHTIQVSSITARK
jgi:nitrogen fixation protein FixH